MTTGGAFTGIRRSAASAGPAAATADAVNAVEVNRWNLGRIAAPVPGIPYARINNSKRPRRANATRRRNSDAISRSVVQKYNRFSTGALVLAPSAQSGKSQFSPT